MVQNSPAKTSSAGTASRPTANQDRDVAGERGCDRLARAIASSSALANLLTMKRSRAPVRIVSSTTAAASTSFDLIRRQNQIAGFMDVIQRTVWTPIGVVNSRPLTVCVGQRSTTTNTFLPASPTMGYFKGC
jgi:hypothetical protein